MKLRRNCITFLLLLSILFVPGSVTAQQDTIQAPANFNNVDNNLPLFAKAIVGIDPNKPFRRTNAWVPIRLEFSEVKEDIEGDVVIRLKDGRVVYKTPVDLDQRVQKVYNLFVHLPPTLDELEFYLETGGKRITLEVITVATPLLETARYVAVMSSERGTHEHLAHKDMENVEFYREVVYTSGPYLPRSWIGYQNIDVLVWDGMDGVALNDDQVKALDQWIQMGGTLVLAAGEQWQELDQSPFRLYSPVTMDDSKVLETNTRLVSVGEINEPVVLPSVVIATGELLDDPNINVRLKAGDAPFLIEREWGAGRVVWVASSIRTVLFAPLYQKIFMGYLTTSNVVQTSKAVDQLDTFITSFLRYIVQAELPSTAFIALYLGCYILILVPVNYVVFRSMKRLEWAWFTIPFWAVLFAYGAYYIGALRQQGNVTSNEVTIVEARPNARTAPATTFCSIYSPVRRWYTVNFSEPRAYPLMPLLSNRFNRPGLATDDSLTISFLEDRTRIEDFLIYHWSQRPFKTQHYVDIGNGIDVDLQWKENRIVGTVTNNSGYTLNSPVMYVKDKEIHVKTLADGETTEISEAWLHSRQQDVAQVYGQVQNQNDLARYNRNLTNMVRGDLNRFYATYYFQETGAQNVVLLVAQIDKASLQFHLNDTPVSPDGSTLLCTVVPLQRALRGRVKVEPASWQLTAGASLGSNRMMGGYGMGMGMGMPMMGSNMPAFQIAPNSEFLGELTTDVPLLHGKISSLKVEVNYALFQLQNQPRRQNQTQSTIYNSNNGKPEDKQLELHLKQEGTDQRYLPLSEIADGDGFVQNPARFVDQKENLIKFRLAAQGDFVSVPAEAVRIHLEMQYGSDMSGTFLGIPLDLAETLDM